MTKMRNAIEHDSFEHFASQFRQSTSQG